MTRSLLIRAVVSCALAIPSAGVWAEEPNSTDSQELDSAAPHKPIALEATRLSGVPKVSRFGDIYLAGQPSEESLSHLKRLGFRTIASLRKKDEIEWDEAAAVEQAGMAFLSVPIGKPEALEPPIFHKVFTVLSEKERQPVLLHCHSANRVGALWYAHRVLNDGVATDKAEAEARQAGLRSQAYLEAAEQYVRISLEEAGQAPRNGEPPR